MKNTLSVKHLADYIEKKNNTSFLTKMFKKALLNKFKGLKIGHLIIEDENETYTFGDSNSKKIAEINILSQEFYVFVGSGSEARAL